MATPNMMLTVHIKSWLIVVVGLSNMHVINNSMDGRLTVIHRNIEVEGKLSADRVLIIETAALWVYLLLVSVT